MKKSAVLTLFWVILSNSLVAQEIIFDWVNNTGGSGSASGWGTAVDATGSTISIGTFSGKIDMDPGPAVYSLTSQSSLDIFIVKYASSGNFLWARRIGGNQVEDSKAIALDDAGNIFLTGTFAGIVDFDPGAAVAYGSLVRFNMQVYNRWGQLIFQSTDPSRGWDGRVNGKEAASGTFVWMCSYQLAGATLMFEKGVVTLIR